METSFASLKATSDFYILFTLVGCLVKEDVCLVRLDFPRLDFVDLAVVVFGPLAPLVGEAEGRIMSGVRGGPMVVADTETGESTLLKY